MAALTLTSILLVVATLLLDRPAARVARNTSLGPSRRWETLSLVAVGAVAAIGVDDPAASTWLEPLRWIVAASTFCGWMAQLGARRPHGAGWQWVVVSLWGVLALPAAETFFLQRGQAFEIHGARGAFLWVLLVGGLLNVAPTRWIGPGLVAAAGRLVLLAPHLPGLRVAHSSPVGERTATVVALALLVAAHAWRTLASVRAKPRGDVEGLWLDYRDEFGAWWGVRVQMQVNAVALAEKWPVELGWSGFRSVRFADESTPEEPNAEPNGASRDASLALADRLDDAQAAQLRQVLWNQVRRFVTPEWVGGRLGGVAEGEREGD